MDGDGSSGRNDQGREGMPSSRRNGAPPVFGPTGRVHSGAGIKRAAHGLRKPISVDPDARRRSRKAGNRRLPNRGADTRAIRRPRDDAERDVRRSLAAALHDGVGQTLQGLNLGLKYARALVRRGEPVPAELLDGLVAEVAEALHQVRALSCELRPPLRGSLSLAEAVRLHAAEMAERAGIDIQVQADDTPFTLADRVKEQCFLAFREALSNALRHAGASRIRVLIRVRRPDRLTLTVLDNGAGFDTRRVRAPRQGLGLDTIHERAEAVLGSARIRSRPGGGTAVRLRIPLRREAVSCP